MGFLAEVFRAIKMGKFSAEVVLILRRNYTFTANGDDVRSLVKCTYGTWNEHSSAVVYLTEYLKDNANMLKGKADIRDIRNAVGIYIEIAKAAHRAGHIHPPHIIDDLVEVARTQYGVV